jgi:serine/threonine protein kinase
MEPGFILKGKYKVAEKVGRGAYSVCYKAVQLNDDGTENDKLPEVLIKVAVKPEVSFLNEYVISQKLSAHNRLLRHRDYDSIAFESKSDDNEKSYDYLVSNYLPNGDMFNFVHTDGFDENCARFVFRHVLKGIESLHNDGYAHMDIKLGNILLDNNFLPKLADFGFAVRIHKYSSLTSKDFKHKGTRHYICPEVYEEEKFDGQAADVFALGVAFFVLVVGDYPFNTATKSDTKYRNLYKKNPLIFWNKHSRAKKRISKGLISSSFIDLITRMLLPKKDDRICIEDIKEHEWY